jgi:hypothetical protein
MKESELGFMPQITSQLMMKKVVDNIYVDNSFIWEKPVKFWYRPRFTIKIPYLYIDGEFDGDRKGLFFGWYPIRIGKRKVINENYRKEMEKYRKQKGLIYFVREGDMKFK